MYCIKERSTYTRLTIYCYSQLTLYDAISDLESLHVQPVGSLSNKMFSRHQEGDMKVAGEYIKCDVIAAYTF